MVWQRFFEMEQLMKSLIFTLAAMLLFPALALGGEKEEAYLKETMIPLAREFF